MNELISKWQNLIAGVLIAAILSYGTYTYLYKPKIKEITSLKNSLKLIDTEIRSVPGGELLLKDLNAAKAMLQGQLDELSKKIPSETQTPYLIDNFITAVGKGLNINYNLIQPLGIEPEKRYKRLPLKVEFEGDYANLNTYLSQLKNLPVTIRVDSMDLHKIEGSRKLQVRMMLSAFVMPGGVEKPQGMAYNYPYVYDPFYAQRVSKTAVKRTEPLTGLKYTGYWLGKEIKAIINDEILKVGQSINGFTVIRIYKDRVILEKDNRMYDLYIVGGK